jgi:hypothetical protein
MIKKWNSEMLILWSVDWQMPSYFLGLFTYVMSTANVTLTFSVRNLALHEMFGIEFTHTVSGTLGYSY